IVPCLDRDGELAQFGFGLSHAGDDAFGDRAEILIFEFLALGWLGAEERTAGIYEVGASIEEVLVDQEILLLGANGREDLLGLFVTEQLEDAEGLVRKRFHRPQQRRFLIESFAGPAQERGRDDERRAVGAFQDVGRAGGVPSGVAARLEGGANAAGGKRRS